MHMRIQESSASTQGASYILGQFSKPFKTVSLMVQYYTENRLPIKGAEHTYLRYPVCEELLWGRTSVPFLFWALFTWVFLHKKTFQMKTICITFSFKLRFTAIIWWLAHSPKGQNRHKTSELLEIASIVGCNPFLFFIWVTDLVPLLCIAPLKQTLNCI